MKQNYIGLRRADFVGSGRHAAMPELVTVRRKGADVSLAPAGNTGRRIRNVSDPHCSIESRECRPLSERRCSSNIERALVRQVRTRAFRFS